MLVRDVMTHQVESVRFEATVQEAARKMRELDVGALPVTDGSRIIGMITDRDITVRSTAAGKDPTRTMVREVSSSGLVYCYEDDDVRNVARMMRDRQLRRIPVVNRGKKLVGIIALKDLVLETGDERMGGEVLEGVSRETEQSLREHGGKMMPARSRSQYDRDAEGYGRDRERAASEATSASGGSAEASYRGAEWDRSEQRWTTTRGHTDRGPFFGRGPRGYKRSDERIREDICERLMADPMIDASDVNVDVNNGEVMLTGTVDDPHTRLEAERLTQQLPGVTRVHNDLRPRRGDEWAPTASGENNIGRNAAPGRL